MLNGKLPAHTALRANTAYTPGALIAARALASECAELLRAALHPGP